MSNQSVLKSRLKNIEIDNIYADGYSDCLKDTLDHINKILQAVNEEGDDVVGHLETFAEQLDKILKADGGEMQ